MLAWSDVLVWTQSGGAARRHGEVAAGYGEKPSAEEDIQVDAMKNQRQMSRNGPQRQSFTSLLAGTVEDAGGQNVTCRGGYAPRNREQQTRVPECSIVSLSHPTFGIHGFLDSLLPELDCSTSFEGAYWKVWPRMASLCRPRLPKNCFQRVVRCYSSGHQQSPFAPRHLLSIADLTSTELTTLVRRAHSHKQASKSGSVPSSLINALAGRTVAMTFSKRSTRTRVSTEGAVAAMGGHPMFLGKDDIQLGVNESLYDTSVVVSSMVSAWVARVNKHSDVADIAKHSTVPVINALSDLFHPLQTLADLLTLLDAFPSTASPRRPALDSLGLEGLKVAWVGDANNVLFDLAIAASKLGITMSVATPTGYHVPSSMLELIKSNAREGGQPAKLTTTVVPEEAIHKANVIVTDTWTSMGQEAESSKRRKDFEGFQVTMDLARRGGANQDWRFMHCLPRHPEEVDDEVFYGPKSLVFPEAENRLWAAMAALEGFVVNKGDIQPI